MNEAPRDQPSRDGDRPDFSWEGQQGPRASDGGDLPPAPDATQVMGPLQPPPAAPSPYPAQYPPPQYPSPQYPSPQYQQQGGYSAPPSYGAPGYGAPPGYAPPPMTPESEDVRGKAILWTILNGLAIFFCGNLGAIVGVILAAIAIGRSRTDVVGARRLVTWSWIWFIIGFGFVLVFLVLYFGFIGTMIWFTSN